MEHTIQRSLKVFIADDSVMVRDRLRNLLSDLALVEVVGEAGDGQQALDEIRALQPEAVILDLSMPRMSGIQVVKQLREERNPAVVIVLTSHSTAEYQNECLQAGANFFLGKVHDIDKLEGILAGLVGRLKN
jgi:DNA-binding NarL/FixJ family response regulator